MLEGFLTLGESPFSLLSLMFNLAIGAVLSICLAWHFRRFGSTLSNRDELARVLPFILLTTILIITIVKSSLALSLGLVGALSIVRFRTPIKEPEELAYLFVAIGMGLGLGAAQTWPTVVGGLSILGLVTAFKWRSQDASNQTLHLLIELRQEAPDRFFENLNETLAKHVGRSDLRRYDVRNHSVEVAYIVNFDGVDKLTAVTEEIRNLAPDVGITFLDQSGLPSI
jgi:hypothetical protein